MRPTRPLYFMLNLAGSGHDFRGVCFSVAYTTPNGKSCRTFPKTRSIYHNSRCTYPLKRPQSLPDAKNAKRQGNTRLNQKNASESFLGRCITMHESDARSVSTVQNDKRVKKTNLPLGKKHVKTFLRMPSFLFFSSENRLLYYERFLSRTYTISGEWDEKFFEPMKHGIIKVRGTSLSRK